MSRFILVFAADGDMDLHLLGLAEHIVKQFAGIHGGQKFCARSRLLYSWCLNRFFVPSKTMLRIFCDWFWWRTDSMSERNTPSPFFTWPRSRVYHLRQVLDGLPRICSVNALETVSRYLSSISSGMGIKTF